MHERNFERTSRPKPKREPMLIRVLVHDVASGETIREHTMNFNNAEKRRWLSKLCVWAFNNGKTVETFNVRDDEDKSS